MKFTKNELREQQKKLEQLQKYLPVLQLKKMLLQDEVHTASLEAAALEEKERLALQEIRSFQKLVTDDLNGAAIIHSITRRIENIAGVEVPYLDEVAFAPFTYDLFLTEPYVDAVIAKLREAATLKSAFQVALEKEEALRTELREVSLRVNLFEKVLLPQTAGNIKKIKVFLGDQDLAAVARAKVAKAKIELRKKLCASM
jgi:V/A-type H+/Na+-transporting ATPase subunit D